MNLSPATRQSLFFALPALVGAALTFWAVFHGFPLSSDGNYHLSAYKGFSEQLFAGEAYPRWVASQFSGLGSPIFFYYPPLAFYFAAALNVILLFINNSLYTLGLAASLGLIFSGYAAYFWLKIFTSRQAAMAGALIYMMAPYHLIADLYIRGAYAEFMAYIALPLVFAGVARLSYKSPRTFVLPALAYAGLIMTHLPSAIIATPVIGVYLLFGALTSEIPTRGKIMLVMAGCFSLILGAGLSAIYALPALGMMPNLNQYALWGGSKIPDYGHWFLCVSSCIQDNGFYSALFIAQTAAGAFLLLLAYGRARKPETAFWFAALLFIFFMTTPFSKPIWEVSLFLPKIQFPARLMIISDLALAYGAAAAVSVLNKRETQSASRAVIFLFSGIVFSLFHWQANLYGTENGDALKSSAINCIARGCAGGEYAPASQKIVNENPAKLPLYEITKGSGSVKAKKISARRWRIQTDAKTKMTFRFHQRNFPGWRADEMDGGVIPISSTGAEGEITLSVPPGRHEINLRLPYNEFEKIGALISALCSLLIAGAFRHKKAAEKKSAAFS